MVFKKQEYSEENISKYNEAGAQLYRIGNLWTSSHYHRQKGNLISWKVNLDCVWLELSSDANKIDKQKINNFNTLLTKYKKDRNFMYQILMEKEIFLRGLQNKQGKGSAYQDPDSDDM